MAMSTLPRRGRRSSSRLLRAAEARELGDAHRERREAVVEILEVLLGQQRRRHQDRHLHSGRHRDEGGAHRDFRLAEPDVARDQPVHRPPARHVRDDRLDGLRLVRRFLEGEAGRERLVVLGAQRERVALARGAQRIEMQQLRRGVAHLLRRLALRLLPLAAAEAMQRRGLRRRPGVAADDVELRDRHVELVAALVFEVQELHLAFAQVDGHEPQVAPDAVLAVHHRIAGLDLGEIAHHPFRAGLRPGIAAARLAHLSRVELGLREDREMFARHQEARGHGAVGQHDGMRGLEEALPVVHEGRVETMLGEELRERLAAPGTLGDDRDARCDAPASLVSHPSAKRVSAFNGSTSRRSTSTEGRSESAGRTSMRSRSFSSTKSSSTRR
jgi:hypothetical protein